MSFTLRPSIRNMELWQRRSALLGLLYNGNVHYCYYLPCFTLVWTVSPQACVYGVAAILWATAKFRLSPNQKLAVPRNLKRLLLEMAKRTAIERPSIVAAKKVLFLPFFFFALTRLSPPKDRLCTLRKLMCLLWLPLHFVFLLNFHSCPQFQIFKWNLSCPNQNLKMSQDIQTQRPLLGWIPLSQQHCCSLTA